MENERARLLAAEAERLAALLAERGATLVVAFGSYARGRITATSDLDLLAVMESRLPFVKRIDRLCTELVPRVGVDLLVYTPAEFDRIRDRPFVRRALAEGHVLHAA